MKIGKYEFINQEQAQTKIDALGLETDENGNNYPTHNNTVVKLGYITLEQGEYDEQGNVIKEPVLSDKYSVDVLWIDGIEAYGWKSYRVNVIGKGVHTFSGIDYDKHKLD